MTVPAEQATAVPVKQPSTSRLASASIIGTLVETYDLVLYSLVAATVFGAVFFPDAAPWIGTLAAIASQAVAFVMRPLGAILFGYIGDRFSRVKALRISLLIMGSATVLIGLLPTASQIGSLAPLLLVVLRLVQGLAVGGEFGGAVLVSTENAPPAKRALFGTFANTGATSGAALAILVSVIGITVLGLPTFTAWGWRVPFLISAILVIVGYFTRRLTESDEFEAAKHTDEDAKENRAGIGRRLQYVGVATLLIIPNVTLFYVIVTAFLAFVRAGGVPGLSVIAYQVITFVAMILSVAINMGGALIATRFSRERIIVAAAIAVIVVAAPAIALIQTGEVSAALIGILLLIPSHGLFSGVATGYLSDSLPVRFRYTGVGLGYALGSAIGGGLLPPLLLWIVGPSGSLWPFAGLIGAVGLIAIAGVSAARRVRSGLASQGD